MESKYGTKFVESELALAAEQEDWEEVERLMAQMSKTEREVFAQRLSTLHRLLVFGKIGAVREL